MIYVSVILAVFAIVYTFYARIRLSNKELESELNTLKNEVTRIKEELGNK